MSASLKRTTQSPVIGTAERKETILSIRNLVVNYKTRVGNFPAIDNLSLDVYKGEVLGLVGESGCGKSTLGRAILRMVSKPGYIASGQMLFEGQDLMSYNQRRMREIRGDKISMIFQDPMTSLNPVQRLDDHLAEAIQSHRPDISRQEAIERSRDLIERLGIGSKRLEDYPHQLSGGMRQRMMIGLALSLKASIIIADEPTTSLDVIVEAQFMDLLRELQRELNLTMILISHNIGLVAEMADRVAVMYAGRIAELAPAERLFEEPRHPYAEGLLKSVPNLELDDTFLYRMEGSLPSLGNMPQGCRFNPRCPHVMDVCRTHQPWFVRLDDVTRSPEHQKHLVACWLYQEKSS
jgi:oligopeptide/dipeptide ABC transporter ATP-binding protein